MEFLPPARANEATPSSSSRVQSPSPALLPTAAEQARYSPPGGVIPPNQQLIRSSRTQAPGERSRSPPEQLPLTQAIDEHPHTAPTEQLLHWRPPPLSGDIRSTRGDADSSIHGDRAVEGQSDDSDTLRRPFDTADFSTTAGSLATRLPSPQVANTHYGRAQREGQRRLADDASEWRQTVDRWGSAAPAAQLSSSSTRTPTYRGPPRAQTHSPLMPPSWDESPKESPPSAIRDPGLDAYKRETGVGKKRRPSENIPKEESVSPNNARTHPEVSVHVDLDPAPQAYGRSQDERPQGGAGERADGQTEGLDSPSDSRKQTRVQRCRDDFPCCCVHFPIYFAVLVACLVPLFNYVCWPGIEIVTDFDTFLEADGRANEVQAAFIDALDLRGPPPSGRRLQQLSEDSFSIDPAILHKIFQLKIMYRAKHSGGMLTARALNAVREFEQHLKSLPGWQRMCEISTEGPRTACEPGISLVNVVWPSERDSHQTEPDTINRYDLDGRGLEPLPLEAALSAVRSYGSGVSIRQDLSGSIFPKDYDGSRVVDSIRSSYEFNLRCCTVYDPMPFRSSELLRLEREYTAFVQDELHPALLDFKNSDGAKFFDVFWEGDIINVWELWLALRQDIFWAIGSVLFIMFYLTFHTGSLCLSIFAIFITICAIPTAFVMSGAMSGANRITGASFLSLFLMVGLGADVVIVFITFWQKSLDVVEEHDYAERIKYLYWHGGVACLATTTTTAASFFANLASVLRALREFGFFMGLCILLTYLLLLAIFPAILIINDKIRCCRCRRLVNRVSEKAQQALGKAGFASTDGRSRFQQGVAFYLERILVPGRWPCALFFIIIPVVFAIWTAHVATVDGGVPHVFPKGHNQRDVKSISERFEPHEQFWPKRWMYVCNAGDAAPRGLCALNWCQINAAVGQAVQGRAGENGSTCVCMPLQENPHCTQVNPGETHDMLASTRFVGLANVSETLWSSADWQSHVSKLVTGVNGGNELTFSSVYPESQNWNPEKSLIQQHWASGSTSVEPYAFGPAMRFLVNAESTERTLCDAAEVCYCGAASCKDLHSSYGLGDTVEVPAGSLRAQQQSRRLKMSDDEKIADDEDSVSMHASPPVFFSHGRRLSSTVDINLLWGFAIKSGRSLLGPPSTDRWQFDWRFAPESPSVQRFMLTACETIATTPELLVVRQSCWPERFRDWLSHQSPRVVYPVRAAQYSTYVRRFVNAGLPAMPAGQLQAADMMWFDNDGRVRAAFAQFDVGMSYDTAGASQIMAYKAHWDRVVLELNADAPASIGQGMVHTSRFWIRGEAEQAIIESTVNTMITSAVCGFLGAFAFTRFDLALSILVVLTVAGVTVTLAWFMSVVFGWAYGAVEILGLIVFVGYSITYSMHVAHKYREKAGGGLFGSGSESYDKDADEANGRPRGNAQRRREAVGYALKAMTSAVLGSAITTLGSSFFLFFCTMRIFGKLAAVLFTVTFLAAVGATVALPSILLCFGPLGFCGCEGVAEALSSQARIAARAARHGLGESDSRRFGEFSREDQTIDSAEKSTHRVRESDEVFGQPSESRIVPSEVFTPPGTAGAVALGALPPSPSPPNSGLALIAPSEAEGLHTLRSNTVRDF